MVVIIKAIKQKKNKTKTTLPEQNYKKGQII